MKLPKLLAGPMIRRVEPGNVYFWLATSKPFQLKANLYIVNKVDQSDHVEYKTLNTITTSETVQAGKHMYIHLLKVVPRNGLFPTDTLLAYNLLFTSESETFDLESLHLLSSENEYSIVYENLKYPTFFIQKNKPNNILYGSCRKPHSKGKDVFTNIDRQMSKNIHNVSRRPSHLFLMGDQIYADDVADPFFYVLSIWSRILGRDGNALVDNDLLREKKNFYKTTSINKTVHSLKNKNLSSEETALDVKEKGASFNAESLKENEAPYNEISLNNFVLEDIELMEPLTRIDSRLDEAVFHTALNSVHGRGYIMKTLCKFTSRHADNHLMTFSEFATMYLLTFSPALWEVMEQTFPTFEQLLEKDVLYFKYPDVKSFQKERRKELKKHRKRYEDQLQEVQEFITALPAVRRVLANTPTYMIFDDHDITDDWNISIDWRENVNRSPLGKHVVSNGLAAYWLFQGWGNDPDAFGQTFKYSMKDYFQQFSCCGSLYENWVNQLWECDTWCFVASTNPISLFLDTRTMRGYDLSPKPFRVGLKMEEGKKTAELISEKGWDKTSQILEESGGRVGEELVIVSPTPLYGIGIIETFLYDYIYPFRILGIPVRYELDFEAWKYNGKGFNQFLQQLAKWDPKHCYILSGDVHYANAVRSKVDFKGEKQLIINQFTSSPIHNMSFSGIWGFLLKIIVWFKGIKRKRRTFYRCCDGNNHLHIFLKKSLNNGNYQWQEEIKYMSPSNGTIVETNNNIGWLTIDKTSIDNSLLVADREQNKYETIYLEDNGMKQRQRGVG